MTSICCLPVKSKSTRVPRKNFQPINGIPLYIIAIQKLKASSFDYFYVDSDSSEVSDYCALNDIPFVQRSKQLASDAANGNHLILDSIQRFPGFDYYFQLFATAPFLTVSSINACISGLSSTDYDSVFTALEKTTWYWSNGRPLNYDPCQLPRSQDVSKIYLETTGLYGIAGHIAVERACRIGFNPLLYCVTEVEAFDIDTTSDLDHARLLSQIIGTPS